MNPFSPIDFWYHWGASTWGLHIGHVFPLGFFEGGFYRDGYSPRIYGLVGRGCKYGDCKQTNCDAQVGYQCLGM